MVLASGIWGEKAHLKVLARDYIGKGTHGTQTQNGDCGGPGGGVKMGSGQHRGQQLYL